MLQKDTDIRGGKFVLKTYPTYSADRAMRAFEALDLGLPEYVAWLFTVLEGYTISIKAGKEAAQEVVVLAEYMKRRDALNLTERAMLFVDMMNNETVFVLHEAYEATREKSLEAAPELQQESGDADFTNAASGQ